MSAPTIETARVRLRAHELQDFRDSAALWADPIVTRHIGGQPLSQEDSWSRLLRYAGHWHLLGFGYWLAEDKVTGAFLGELGFADYKRDLQPSLNGIPEAGWVFAPSAHGKGYATESLQAILEWGKRNLASSRTTCLIAPENSASIRVAEKCGYQEGVRTTYKGKPTTIFFRDR